MKKKILYILIVVVGIGVFFGFQQQQKDYRKERTLLTILNYVLTQGHFEKKAMDNVFSEKVFTEFLKGLDPLKRYFLKSDIDEFKNYETLLLSDNKTQNRDILFFNLVHQRFLKRLNEAENRCKTLLDQPFDFSKNETVTTDYKKTDYCKTEEELTERWKKQLKSSILSKIYIKETEQKDKAKKDKSKEDKVKKDSVAVKKPFKTLEKEARETTQNNFKDFFERMSELTYDDWFSTYVNTMTSQFDPHTTYLDPSFKRRFDISMSGKLEGIGAVLQKKNGFVKVVELVVGGPAWKGGELEAEDLILKAGEGDSEPTDLTGMRLDKAIDYIKGKKGTEVRLTIKKIDGTIKTISIVRDVVELEETFVKSSIVNKNGKKYAIIHLPKFYINFEEQNYRNSATDMAKEIERLKKENVEGLVIDLRNNGGGSLKTAIEISGLFIEEGPVVQVKYRGKDPIIKEDKDPAIQWDKPLAILVNESSASASEIFSGAMKDYHRAVIIGSKQTYGKGTVQTVIDLNRYSKLKKEDLGALKMTIQKFYRVNGKSTQLEGIHSDIVIPTKYRYLDIGERDLDNPLPNDTVAPANYKVWKGYKNFDKVVAESQKRMLEKPYFKLLDESAKWLKTQKDDHTIYLEYGAYVDDVKKGEEASKKFKKLKDYKSSYSFVSPDYELPLFKEDKELKKKRDKWHENLGKDAYVEEAINVVSQLITE
ncbi:MAG: carboxy terminal-processing peptidase [Flavobacteriaceae bacterium]|nr:carboxy terminal-processing peptidase [Flavobacteriaceae bacterium]